MASIYDDGVRRYSEERDDPDNPVGPEQLTAVLSYLNGITTPSEAAHELCKGDNESKTRSTELPWELLIDAAKEFPQAHQKLIELFDAIVQWPVTEEGTAQWSGRCFSDIMIELNDIYSGTESHSQRSDSSTADERHYINLCAFIARFWHAQHNDWTNWALHVVSTALEEEHREALTNLFGQAVAQLFLFSGPELYAISDGANTSGPLLLEERETAAVPRWEFWKRRFSQLMGSELLSNETQELFSRALESMAKVEAEQ